MPQRPEVPFQTSLLVTRTAHTHPPVLPCPPIPTRLTTILPESQNTLIGQPEERADLLEAVRELGGKVRNKNDL